jgi:hypothetical protein
LHGAARWLSAVVLIACQPPTPAAPDHVELWKSVADSLVSRLPGDAYVRARVLALTSVARYEGFAADRRTGLRSLAGQINGLWSVPLPGRAVDGAIVALEAQRMLLDSLLAGDTVARRAVDSLVRAQLASRRAAGIGADLAERSLQHGAAVAKTVLALTDAQAPRTFVLRHADECAWAPRSRDFPVTVQGGAAGDSATGPPASAHEAAESQVLAAIVRADEIAVSVRARARVPDALGACIDQRARARLRTR